MGELREAGRALPLRSARFPPFMFIHSLSLFLCDQLSELAALLRVHTLVMAPRTTVAQFFLSTLAVLISARLIPHVVAQNLPETIWSSVLVTRNGDSIPLISSSPAVLTPLGAQQMFSTGALFRDRYLSGNSTIPAISKSEIDSTQTLALSLLAEYVESSAQAFMQGLYPPDQNTIISSTSRLANGTTISPPLGKLIRIPLLYVTDN